MVSLYSITSSWTSEILDIWQEIPTRPSQIIDTLSTEARDYCKSSPFLKHSSRELGPFSPTFNDLIATSPVVLNGRHSPDLTAEPILDKSKVGRKPEHVVTGLKRSNSDRRIAKT